MSRKKKWDVYFISLAYLVSMKSKDPKVRVGSVIVNDDYLVISTGFNGFPRGFQDLIKRYEDVEFRINIECHAEENAILNAARNGTKLKGSTLYVNWHPCISCARKIVQVGIKNVIYHAEFPGNNEENKKNSKHRFDMAEMLLRESNVTCRSVSCKIIKPSALYKNNIFNI